MKILYSNILPLSITEGQQTIIECFHEQAENADRIEIAVGYISKASLLPVTATSSLVQSATN